MLLTCFKVLIVSFLATAEGYKVLGVLPFISKSHFSIGHSILSSLLEAGNEVTVISPYPQKKQVKNYHDVDFSSSLVQFQNGMKKWIKSRN